MRRLLLLLVVLMCSAAALALNTSNCPSGMISYWTFDNYSNATKDDYNGNYLSNGGATWNSSGKVGGALRFSGSNVLSHPRLNISGPLSVEVWVKTNTSNAGIVSRYLSNGVRNYDLFISSSGNISFLVGGSFLHIVTAPFIITDNNWHHVVGTYDMKNISLYVDGQLVAREAENRSTYGFSTWAFCVGNDKYDCSSYGDYGGTPNNIKGLIDEVALYSSALSPGTVYSHYVNGNVYHVGYCESIPICGNGIKEAGEECDGTDLGGKTCSDFYAQAGGQLACNNCTFNISNCDTCPDPDGSWNVTDTQTIARNVTCNSITISNGAALLINNTENIPGGGMLIRIPTIAAENITVENGGMISADGKGYAQEQGPGAGTHGYNCGSSGGSHGGNGGIGRCISGAYTIYSLPKYGSALLPANIGSGGGQQQAAGGAGGGAMKIIAKNFQLDGNISANGMNGLSADYSGAGGSGGSILAITDVIRGNGRFLASGGNGGPASTVGGAGGAGGRIAVYYNSSTLVQSNSKVSGGFASGGNFGGGTNGEAGTIAFIDVPNNDIYTPQGFEFQYSPFIFDNIYINNSRLSTNATPLIINVSGTISISNSSFINSTVPLSIYAYTIDLSNSRFNMSEINLYPFCNRLFENNVNYSSYRNYSPNPQYETCGNNITEGCEQCDDGNNVSDDGCSATCTVEAIDTWDTIISPEGVYEPNKTNLSGTHLHTFEIRFTGVNASTGNALGCSILAADNSIVTAYKIVNQTLQNANESIFYTIPSYSAASIDKTKPWRIIECGKATNGKVYTHLNTWSQFDYENDDAFRALDCWMGFSKRYFNNTERCNYEGDVAFAVAMAKGVKVEGNCHDGIDNDNNGQIDCNDRYCKGITYECITHQNITG